jgi:hypothetical protein
MTTTVPYDSTCNDLTRAMTSAGPADPAVTTCDRSMKETPHAVRQQMLDQSHLMNASVDFSRRTVCAQRLAPSAARAFSLSSDKAMRTLRLHPHRARKPVPPSIFSNSGSVILLISCSSAPK